MKFWPVIRHIRWGFRVWRKSRRSRLYQRMHGDRPYLVNADREKADINDVWEGKQ